MKKRHLLVGTVAGLAFAVTAALAAQATEDDFVPHSDAEVYNLPAGWNDPATTPAYAADIFPQTVGEGCGWNQADTYWIETVEEEAILAAIRAAGVLNQDDDSSIYQSHRFYFVTCDVGEPEGPGTPTITPTDVYVPTDSGTSTPIDGPDADTIGSGSGRSVGGEDLAVTGPEAWTAFVAASIVFVTVGSAAIVASRAHREQH
jgi:hypothetical protein